MRNLIYQFYEGNLTPGNKAGIELMKEYCDRIRIEHLFELNPTWPPYSRIKRKNLGRYNPHYGAFKFIFDEKFDSYDNIMFCDCDVIPVDNLLESPFDEFNKEIGICEEYMMPDLRTQYNIGGINIANDKKYATLCETKYNVLMLKDNLGRPRVFNSGMVLYSKPGRIKARKIFPDFKEYCQLMSLNLPPFYQGDQNYLNAILAKFDWQLMDYKWNSQIFFQPGTLGDNRPILDYRSNPNFVHVQLRGADEYSMDKLKRVVNGEN